MVWFAISNANTAERYAILGGIMFGGLKPGRLMSGGLVSGGLMSGGLKSGELMSGGLKSAHPQLVQAYTLCLRVLHL